MTSPTTGWAIGTDGTVLHSTDGGAVWNAMSSLTVKQAVAATLHRTQETVADNPIISATFPSSTVAWISVKIGSHIQVFRTVNSGQRWQETFLPTLKNTSTIQLSVAGSTRAWVMDTVNGLAGASTAKLWATSDGGTHWHLVYRGPAPANVSMTFGSNGVGWETGATPVFNQVVMARSMDGGSHWTPWSWALPNGEYQVTTFTPQFDGASPVVPSLLVNQNTESQQWIFEQWNAATHTWHFLPALPTGTYHGVNPPLSAFVGAHAWVVGSKELDILHRGQWHAVRLPAGHPTALSFVTDKRGWLLQSRGDRSTLWMTTNGGENWKTVAY